MKLAIAYLVCAVLIAGTCFVGYRLVKGGPFKRAERLFEKRDYPAAAVRFQQAVEQDDRKADALVYLARIAGIGGRFDDGIALCKQAIQADPRNSGAYYFEAVLLQLSDRSRESEQPLTELADLPGAALAIASLGGLAQSGRLTPKERDQRMALLKGEIGPADTIKDALRSTMNPEDARATELLDQMGAAGR